MIPLKPNIEMNKKTMIGIAGFVVIGALFFLLIRPLWGKINKISQELKVLDSELVGVREAVKKGHNLDHAGHLLRRQFCFFF